MRYYAQYNESSKLIAIGTGPGGTEITEAEYNAFLSMIREKADLVGKLYNGEITIDSIREDWQEEIKRRVDERKANEPNTDEVEATTDDLINALSEIGIV